MQLAATGRTVRYSFLGFYRVQNVPGFRFLPTDYGELRQPDIFERVTINFCRSHKYTSRAFGW